MSRPICLDEHGRRVPTRPCHVTNCDREWPMYRKRLQHTIELPTDAAAAYTPRTWDSQSSGPREGTRQGVARRKARLRPVEKFGSYCPCGGPSNVEWSGG